MPLSWTRGIRDQVRARKSSSFDNPARKESWSDNPEEMDQESSRNGPAALRRNLSPSAELEYQMHQQQPSTPFQEAPAQQIAQQAMVSRATPSPLSPRQVPGFFAPSSPALQLEPAQSQASVSSALTCGSSLGSGSLPPASFFTANQKSTVSAGVFGKDYVCEVTEVFYIREKPEKPQSMDGTIRYFGHYMKQS